MGLRWVVKVVGDMGLRRRRRISSEAPGNSTFMGVALLQAFDVPPERDWYWIGVGALVGFTVLLNVLFTISLQYLNRIGKPRAIISKKKQTRQFLSMNQRR
ncbi:hypothetical protein Droror1_Dr00011241 [Drosera rotundifolia]